MLTWHQKLLLRHFVGGWGCHADAARAWSDSKQALQTNPNYLQFEWAQLGGENSSVFKHMNPHMFSGALRGREKHEKLMWARRWTAMPLLLSPQPLNSKSGLTVSNQTFWNIRLTAALHYLSLIHLPAVSSTGDGEVCLLLPLYACFQGTQWQSGQKKYHWDFTALCRCNVIWQHTENEAENQQGRW